MTDFSALSRSLAAAVAAGATRVCAVGTGPNRHITGLVCEGGVVVTCDQDLPALGRYSVVMPGGILAAGHPGPRDPGSHLATLTLETPWPVANPEITAGVVGGLVIVLGADADASPTVRLTVVHRLARLAHGHACVLDLCADQVDSGGLVIDSDGRLIGLVAQGPGGEALALPSRLIEMLMSEHVPERPEPAPLPAPIILPNRRAWLGVALQPIVVPAALAGRAGQTSGRMVVSLTRGGPAEMAGLRIGDVLLAMNGTSASGPQALRAFMTPDRIGSTIEVKLLRDGQVLTTDLTVASQPD